MAVLRQYFDTDFSNTFRIKAKLKNGLDIHLLYDVTARTCFLALYVPGASHSVEYFVELITNLHPAKTQIIFGGGIGLPSTRAFRGRFSISKDESPYFKYLLAGAHREKSSKDISMSIPTRTFIYSETNLGSAALDQLYATADKAGHDLEFRAKAFCDYRALGEGPLAFISHDSRDKEQIAQVLATNLQSMLCPVWYDEYSLKVGENLRQSIEKGIRECRKCILILSPNFFSNSGWTSAEFDSIYLRQIKEGNVILPVWCGVTKDEVEKYCSSLPMIVGLDWNKLGADEVTRRLFLEIAGKDQPVST